MRRAALALVLLGLTGTMASCSTEELEDKAKQAGDKAKQAGADALEKGKELGEQAGEKSKELAGRAKDMGSAAVFVLMMNVILVWALILGPRLLQG